MAIYTTKGPAQGRVLEESRQDFQAESKFASSTWNRQIMSIRKHPQSELLRTLCSNRTAWQVIGFGHFVTFIVRCVRNTWKFFHFFKFLRQSHSSLLSSFKHFLEKLEEWCHDRCACVKLKFHSRSNANKTNYKTNMKTARNLVFEPVRHFKLILWWKPCFCSFTLLFQKKKLITKPICKQPKICYFSL